MAVKIFASPYELKPRTSLSSRAGSDLRHGALLKIEDPEIGVGYADLHPWPELGDHPLEDQLELLSRGILTPLTRNSIQCSKIDATARSQNRSIWEGLSIPPSHALVSDVESLLNGNEFERLMSQGFDRIKIKLGRNPEAEASLLNELKGRIRLRLDFNSSLTQESWQQFCDKLSDQTVNAIEFIEDPIAWDSQNGFGSPPRSLALALDRDAEHVSESSVCPQYLIIKPAISEVGVLLERAKAWRKKVVFTSYLDHPVGQLWAAYCAAQAARELPVEVCGLLSQDAYEPHPLRELIQSRGPELQPLTGPGFGWAEMIEKHARWKELAV